MDIIVVLPLSLRWQGAKPPSGGFCILGPLLKTNVYIDAFNLYYRALRNTPYRWLDLSRLCQILFPSNQINAIKYFTALVSARPNDVNQPVRQQIYIRALNTIPNLSVIYGHYLSHVVNMPVANCPPGQQKYASVIKTEEKGSDVNIASHLIHDGHLNQYDAAIVISNDSDLLEPIKIVRNDLGKKVGIVIPNLKSHPSTILMKNADFIRGLRESTLRASQFPSTLRDKHGLFTKPDTW